MNARRRAWFGVVLLGLAVGCHGEDKQVPEAGALLLQVGLAGGAPVPDELRLSAYDDSGTLWSGARFPAEGALVPQSPSSMGTILIRPGTTVGDVRIDLRGLRGEAVVTEAILIVTPAERATATLDLMLSTALPSDLDGDGVPDPIDDCPAVPDPAQTGCGRDAGAGGPDAAAGQSGQAGAGGQAGDSGVSGAGGSGGTGGSGDTTGAGGQAGAVGAGGSGGTAGTTGTGGQAGGAGTGGQAGSAGAGGRGGAAGTMGTGGQTGGAGGGLPQGTTCTAASQCASGFCKDGACCNNACTGACNSCATGVCTTVTNGQDAPECVTPMSCNKAGKCVGN